MKKNFLAQISFLTLTAFAILISLSSSANAQNYPYYNQNYGYENRNYGYNSSYSPALDNGYRLGFGAGSNDRAYRESYRVDRNKTYRDGDSGYRGEYGSRDDYKRAFRSAYEQGYRDGYDGRSSRIDGNGRSYTNNNYPRYNQYPSYGSSRGSSRSCTPTYNRRGWRY